MEEKVNKLIQQNELKVFDVTRLVKFEEVKSGFAEPYFKITRLELVKKVCHVFGDPQNWADRIQMEMPTYGVGSMSITAKEMINQSQ